MKQPFGVIDENVGDVFALRGIMLSSDNNRPSDQREAADCQNSHHDVFLCHPTGTIGIPPVSIVAHSFNLRRSDPLVFLSNGFHSSHFTLCMSQENCTTLELSHHFQARRLTLQDSSARTLSLHNCCMRIFFVKAMCVLADKWPVGTIKKPF